MPPLVREEAQEIIRRPHPPHLPTDRARPRPLSLPVGAASGHQAGQCFDGLRLDRENLRLWRVKAYIEGAGDIGVVWDTGVLGAGDYCGQGI